MKLMFDGLLFEDLNQRLKVLGELFSSKIPRTKDAQVSMMVQEARVHSFLHCHKTFADFLHSIYEKSDISKKEGTDPKNSIGEVLTQFYKEGALTKVQVGDFAEQFDSATLLSYDTPWLTEEADKKFYQQRYAKISRYYYMMSTFAGDLSKKVAFIPQGVSDEQATK